jgi:hypothetical protein
VGAVSGFSGAVVFLEDFFVLELELVGSVVVLSVAVSVLGAASVFGADFLELLFFSLELLLVLFEDGLVALSAAGLVVFSAAGLLVVFDALVDALGEAFVLGVAVAATDAVAAGVIVAPTLAEVAGVGLALVDAALFVVVVAPVVVLGAVVVVPVVVVPLVEVTPALKLGVTP